MIRALLLAFITGCWVGPAYVVDDPWPTWCEYSSYPDSRCETHYVWVAQGYRYNGRWHGGRYVRRPGVHVRDHRR